MGATSGDCWVVYSHGGDLVGPAERQEEKRVRREDNLRGSFNIDVCFCFVAVYRSPSFP